MIPPINLRRALSRSGIKALGARHNGRDGTAWTTSGKWRPIAPSASPRPPQSPTLPIPKRRNHGYLATISAPGAEGFDYCPCGASTLPPVGLPVLPIGRRIIRVTQTASAMPAAAFILPRVAVPYASCCCDVVAKTARSRASERDRSALNDYPAGRVAGDGLRGRRALGQAGRRP
jgi:hypothetical protein